MDKKAKDGIEKLQLIEQKVQSLLGQKQNFQAQLMEIENAISELEDSNVCYKIVGNIMVEGKKDKIKKDLNSKKEILDLRIKNIEKQENSLKEEASSIKKEVMKGIKNEPNNKGK